MRTKEEIENKIKELYTLMSLGKIDIVRTIVYSDALSWVLGEDYLDEFKIDFRALYETKCDEVDTLYRIILQIYKELSLLKLKECPEEEFKNIPLEICDWIEQLAKIKEETEIDRNELHQ